MTDFDLTEPDHFTAGTVGEPGRRVFFLQARQDGQVVSLRLEKEQVARLGEYLGGLLENLAPPDGPVPDPAQLIQPVVEEWIVGALAVGYDAGNDRFLVEATELVLSDDTDESDVPALSDDAATARFHITREQVAAFVPHVAELVVAGRPLCPICGRPMDAEGHVCARSNGHRPH